VVEITSAIITEKKSARLPLVMRNTKNTNAEPMTPEAMLTAIGVANLPHGTEDATVRDMPRTRALGVIRLSKSADPASTSLLCQREILEDYAQRENMEIVGIAEDPAVSAFRVPPERRKQIRKCLDRSDEYDCLIYWRQDRIVRRAKDFIGLVTWCKEHGKGMYSATEGLGDVTQHHGLLIGFITAWQSEGESMSTAARTVSSQKKLAELGRWRGGRHLQGTRPICICHQLPKCPEGKDAKGWKLVADEKGEAPVIREAARRVIAGESAHAVTVDFNERGLRARDGGMWQAVVLRHILRNPGLMEYDLLSPAEFAQLQRALKQRRQQRNVRTYDFNSMLLDVVFCTCGGKIYRWKRTNGTYRGRCRNEMKRGQVPVKCDMPMMPYDFLERAVEDDILRNHGTDIIETRVTNAIRRARVNEIDAELSALTLDWTARRIDRIEFTKRQNMLMDEQESLLRAGEGDPPEWQPTGETVAEHWARISDADRRLWLLRIGMTWTVRVIESKPCSEITMDPPCASGSHSHVHYRWSVSGNWDGPPTYRVDPSQSRHIEDLRRERVVRATMRATSGRRAPRLERI
jgi:DNA invertase Pin-like site-specific DNA recombinase